MNIRKAALGAALAVSTATMAHAGVIIAPVAATIDAGGPGSGSIGNTFDQSGLSIGYTAGVTDFDTYIASGPTHTLTFGGYEWFSNYGTTSATVTYDFGALVTISALALWNEESSGIGHLNLTAPSLGTIASVDPVDVPYGDYGAQVFNFAPVTTRYLTFEMSGCPGWSRPKGAIPRNWEGAATQVAAPFSWRKGEVRRSQAPPVSGRDDLSRASPNRSLSAQEGEFIQLNGRIILHNAYRVCRYLEELGNVTGT